jgi:hypothetical protein
MPRICDSYIVPLLRILTDKKSFILYVFVIYTTFHAS